MSAPINLNKHRKARAKAAKKTQADENAVRFGRTKAEKDAEKSQAAKDARHLDGHKRET
ncbi:DUF4169 family protein [Roseobacter sinensis]|uniref:DUF4169 family protein n=1 Tax=Roseobacter sinensis TaxID=2931391 RepID=A0ABT3BFP8_9RHOB|nr:DUF4169 family protein [Roseobacter sp. WL0113]MCV3271988.1 DUF4169 family protein [Roseobacter sp. WL0113]